MGNIVKPLTRADKEEVFRIATKSLPKRYAKEIQNGMTDDELSKALANVLGLFGGSCGPDRLSTSFKGTGLKIWGGWHIVNHVLEAPLFQGQQTVRMARYVYNIPDPRNMQFWFGL